ncbi:SH3 domain-containing protein [Rhizobium rhizogenes]|uniref:SH3 domain-containing protein n=1 Tax=Rhizobium rhizogenes TaxID=359 RepID=UPI0015716E74|nr:SH3 domain-containing protein [Rhizobium rhizogenes]NTG45262.1 hypothetical protein [Rhizobium rhizogenes]
MKKAVVEDHKATYLDPITVKAGDMISLSGKTDNWDGHTWLWADGPNGKAGWITGKRIGIVVCGANIDTESYLTLTERGRRHIHISLHD